ncbi:MAG: hypothetical protein KDJ52_11810 [Anaerolineae bacterium]|nr:hypothetical protein [Anaerolineae bacterium]
MQQVRSSNSNLGLMIIVGTLAILVVILLTAIGILIMANRSNSSGINRLSFIVGTNILNRLDVDKIDPALALASLGGADNNEVITEAVAKERPETAFSALLFDTKMSNRESAGGFLQLAASYRELGEGDKAIFSYEMAGTVATLSPDIPDTTRADVFIQAGERLGDLGEPTLAKFYLDQAFVLATKSLYLQPAHRRTIFEQLHDSYLAIGENQAARQSLNLSANPPKATISTVSETILPASPIVPLPATAQEAEAYRWQVAQELTAILVDRAGNAPVEYVEKLGQALVTEDAQKMPFYESEFAETTQLSEKIAITLAQVDWLSLKYRVARRGYGLSLVPEWEEQAEQIRAQLTKTYETLFALYADLTVALPEVSQIDRATEERLRKEILAGQLGRYPNYPEEQRKKQLLDITNKLIATQPDINVFVAVGTVNNREKFRLISLE